MGVEIENYTCNFFLTSFAQFLVVLITVSVVCVLQETKKNDSYKEQEKFKTFSLTAIVHS